MTSPVRVLSCLLAAVLSFTGCGASSNQGAGNPPIQTAAPVDPYAIPPVIDAAYIERVMAKHAEIRFAYLNQMIADRRITPASDAILRALYSGRALESEIGDAVETTTNDLPDGSLAAHDRFRVKRLISADRTCIAAVLTYVAGFDGSSGDVEIVLRTRPHDLAINPTPWTQDVYVTAVNEGDVSCAG